MATPEREPLRWGVIPLVDGHELLRAQGTSAQTGAAMTIEFQLMRNEAGHPTGWRHEIETEDEEEPIRSAGHVLASVLRWMPDEQRRWAVRQEVQALHELAAEIRDLLLGGIYGKATVAMRLFQSHLRTLELDDEFDDASAYAEELLNQEPRTVPLDDLSHSVVCLAQTETPDGMVLVEGLRAEDNSGVPAVIVKDSDTHADPFTIRLVTPEMADALWAAVYGARVVVWGEPTPFHGRS